jgi:hypothetical protein
VAKRDDAERKPKRPAAEEPQPGETALPFQPQSGKRGHWVWIAVIALAIAAAGYNTTQSPADPDETEHLHAAWLWSQGLHPYTDFFEHHAPAYWFLLRPIVGDGHSTNLATLVIKARAISWLAVIGSIVAAWWLFSRLFGPAAAWYGACLWAIFCALMLALMMFGTALALDAFGLSPLGGPGRLSLVRGGVAGLLLGAAVCVLSKAGFWLMGLGAAVGVVAIYSLLVQRQKGRLLVGLTVLAGVVAVVCIQVIWVLTCNDWGDFWRCNVQANSHNTGLMLTRNTQALRAAVASGLFSWEMAPMALAIPGLVHLLARKEEAPWPGKLIVIALLASSLTLILIAAGPFTQYHLPFLAITSGVAGLGLAAAVATLTARLRLVAAAALLGVLLVIGWLARDYPPSGQSHLTMSLEPLQYVADQAKPTDRYLGITGYNPVYVMDSDPKYFMYWLCFQTDADFNLLPNVINQREPRFIVGFNAPLYVPQAGVISLPMGPGNSLLQYYCQPRSIVLQRK